MKRKMTSPSREETLIETTNVCSNIVANRCSLDFQEGVTFTEWSNKGRELGTIINLFVSHVPWWIGDWIIAGESYFPSKYTQALDETMYSKGRLRNCVYVCTNVAKEDRNEDLSFEHHYQIAKLEPEKQRYWLNRASAENWTVKQLRAAVTGKRISTRAVPDNVFHPEVMEKIQDFDLWWDTYDGKAAAMMPQSRQRVIAEAAWTAALKGV